MKGALEATEGGGEAGGGRDGGTQMTFITTKDTLRQSIMRRRDCGRRPAADRLVQVRRGHE